MTEVVVGRPADFPDGTHRIVEVDGRRIGVFRIGGRFYALPNRCPQLGFEERFAYEVSTSQLCSVETIAVITGSAVRGGPRCSLGKFTPVRYAEPAAN